jgi:hypothetical protein
LSSKLSSEHPSAALKTSTSQIPPKTEALPKSRKETLSTY